MVISMDGVCETAPGNGQCTLRAAIEEANSDSERDNINFDIPTTDSGFNPATGVWTINLTKALPIISNGDDINGPGANMLIVRRNTGGDYSIFTVTSVGEVRLSGMTISNGSNDNGGGISNLGQILDISNCTISGNSATLAGGGIYNFAGIVNVTDSTLNGNHCDNFGGGIFNTNAVNVTNSTFYGNSSSFGGAIETDATVIVTNSTITNNQATFGGGIDDFGGNVAVTSSIIALNTASFGPDANGDFSSSGFNLIGKADAYTSGFDQPTDLIGLDPKLDPNGLQNNGGPTQTVALLFGSPAIDQGTNMGLTGSLSTDQRGTGFARTFNDDTIPNAVGGDGTDIGAFEIERASTPTPTPTPTTLGNISTRLSVQSGDSVLIGGFIIAGTEPKKVLLRAIGPSLTSFGVSDALTDPILELHSGAAILATNDNWMDAPNKEEIINSTLAPNNGLESAILMTLSPGAYTAIMSGVNNTTGVALMEAYDLDTTVDSKLANISTRGLVQTDDNVMIGGFIVLGSNPQRVIVRAIGPSLADFGVDGALGDPTLELHNPDGSTLASNDNWRATQEAEISATGLSPAKDLESAIVATLPPNAYTAIVRGVNGTTGVALVEVYALPPAPP